MEDLIKRKRVSFSESRKDEKRSGRVDSLWDADIAEAGSKALSWLKRHLDNLQVREEVFEPRESEFTTALAATAFAVDAVAEENAEKERRRKEVRANFEQPRSSKAKSRKDVEGSLIRERSRRSGSFRRSLSQEINISGDRSGDGIKRRPSLKDRMAQSPASSRPSITPSPARPRVKEDETRVDAWEKHQIEKIKKRNDKLKTSIDEWENGKKFTAKLRMERKKRDLEERRQRNTQKYRAELSRVEMIAGGARNREEENRRSKEAKVREQAKKMRISGRVPVKCFGFYCCYY